MSHLTHGRGVDKYYHNKIIIVIVLASASKPCLNPGSSSDEAKQLFIWHFLYTIKKNFFFKTHGL